MWHSLKEKLRISEGLSLATAANALMVMLERHAGSLVPGSGNTELERAFALTIDIHTGITYALATALIFQIFRPARE